MSQGFFSVAKAHLPQSETESLATKFRAIDSDVKAGEFNAEVAAALKKRRLK